MSFGHLFLNDSVLQFVVYGSPMFVTESSLARVSKLPVPAFGSTVASQDLEEGQMGSESN